MEQSVTPQLLIRTLRAEFPGDLTGELARLARADWERLITWAAKHQVATLFYARLLDQRLEILIPAPLRKRLQSFYQADVGRNARLLHALGEVLTALQQADISVIPLKDAYLAEVIYPDFGIRRINELELLVAPADLPAAVETLRALGFHPFGPLRPKSNTVTAPLPRFLKAGLPASLLLQQTLTTAKALVETVDMAGVWQRALPIKLAGVPTRSLAYADQLLVLADQMIQHQLMVRGLYAACDLNLFLRQHSAAITWDQVQEQTHLWQWDKQVHLALYLTKTLLATPLSEACLSLLQPPDFSEELAHQAITQLLANGWASGEASSALPASGYRRLLDQGLKILQHLHLARSTPSHV